MSRQRAPRPAMVWVISLVLGLVAIMQMGLLSAILVPDSFGLSGAAIRAQLSSLELLALYGSSALLLTALVFLFQMRKHSVGLLMTYVGLGSWVALAFARFRSLGPDFNALAAFGGIAVMLAVLGYAISLKARGTLT